MDLEKEKGIFTDKGLISKLKRIFRVFIP